MATIKQVTELVNSIAPESAVYKDSYDNVGLLIGDHNAFVDRVLCTLDVTMAVLNEAQQQKAQLIISHHPAIFSKPQINDSNPTGRLVMQAIKREISVFSAHTNLDFVQDGINDCIARALGLTNLTPMQYYNDDKYGFGRVGQLDTPLTVYKMAGIASTVLKDDMVRLVGDKDKAIKRVAIINGAGGGDTKYIDWALRANADCLISADVKHHVAIYAQESGLPLIELQHYCTEHPFVSVLTQKLNTLSSKQNLSVQFVQSTQDKNPRQKYN